MKAAISVKSPFSHNAWFGFIEASFGVIPSPSAWTPRRETGGSPLQDYNCAMHLLEHQCPSVAMICSGGLREQIAFRVDLGTLQGVRSAEWMHSPRS